MNKKIVTLCVMTLLITTTILAHAATNPSTLDQAQEVDDGYTLIKSTSNHWQEFVPTLSYFQKLELKLSRYETDQNGEFTVIIKDSSGQLYTKSGPIDISTIPASSYPYATGHWITVKWLITPKAINPGETYTIGIKSDTLGNSIFNWHKGFYNPYPQGDSSLINPIENVNSDFCFRVYGSESSFPDLDIEINPNIWQWEDCKPGSTKYASIQILNIGEKKSELSWKIADYPDWGEWTFHPKRGSGLTPSSEGKYVNVTIKIPYEQNQKYSGTVKIVNSNNPDDYETIPLYIKTSKTKAIQSTIHDATNKAETKPNTETQTLPFVEIIRPRMGHLYVNDNDLGVFPNINKPIIFGQITCRAKALLQMVNFIDWAFVDYQGYWHDADSKWKYPYATCSPPYSEFNLGDLTIIARAKGPSGNIIQEVQMDVLKYF